MDIITRSDGFSGTKEQAEIVDLKAEIKRLRAENKSLREENDLFKSALRQAGCAGLIVTKTV